MNSATQDKWNNIYADVDVGRQSVSKVIQDNCHLLPVKGKALDLACGMGGDAIFLAKQGLSVDAWDISDAVINKLNRYAVENKLSISGAARDITENPPAKDIYDVITVSHYLDRDLMPILVQSLKRGGLIFYQTFSKTVTPSYTGPKNPDFRLDENELLQLFSDLHLVAYREEGLNGDVQRGFRNEVLFVGQKK